MKCLRSGSLARLYLCMLLTEEKMLLLLNRIREQIHGWIFPHTELQMILAFLPPERKFICVCYICLGYGKQGVIIFSWWRCGVLTKAQPIIHFEYMVIHCVFIRELALRYLFCLRVSLQFKFNCTVEKNIRII